MFDQSHGGSPLPKDGKDRPPKFCISGKLPPTPDRTPFWKMLVQNRPFGILGHGLRGGNKNILPS